MLFASYYGGTSNHIEYKSRHRLYEFRVFRGGRIARRWVPVRTPEGVVTLYDRITDELVPIKGTGKLIAGPVWEHEGPVVIPLGVKIIIR